MSGTQAKPLAPGATLDDALRAINQILAVFEGNIDQNLVIKAGNKVVGDIMGLIRADKDSDGDYDALTAAAWENSTKSGTGTIAWGAVFGVPTAAVAVVVWARMITANGGDKFTLKAKSGTTNPSFQIVESAASNEVIGHGIVPIAADGTSYYAFSAGVTTFELRVVGWFS